MTVLILENIRSAYNVGAIFRTADATQVAKIYLVGYTPTPIDRFGRMQPEIQKTSLGACEYISWEVRESVEELVSELKQQEYELVAVEINSHSQSLIDYCPVDKVAYIMGNEIEGVSKQTLKSVDQVRHIPMAGKKESLNVSVAAGVVMYHGLYKK